MNKHILIATAFLVFLNLTFINSCKKKETEKIDTTQVSLAKPESTKIIKKEPKPLPWENVTFPPKKANVVYGVSKKRTNPSQDSIWTFKVPKGMTMKSLGVPIYPDAKFEKILRVSASYIPDLAPESGKREVIEVAFSTDATFDEIVNFYSEFFGSYEPESSPENGICFFSYGGINEDEFIHVFYTNKTKMYNGKNELHILHSIRKPATK